MENLNTMSFADLKALKASVDAAFDAARGAQIAALAEKQAALKAAQAELVELSGAIGATNRGRPKGSKNKPKGAETVTETPATE